MTAIAVGVTALAAAGATEARKAAPHRMSDAEYRVVIEQRLVGEDLKYDRAIAALQSNLPDRYAKLVDILVDDRKYVDMDSPEQFAADVRLHMGEVTYGLDHQLGMAPSADLRALLIARAAAIQALQQQDPGFCDKLRSGALKTTELLTPEALRRMGSVYAAEFRAARGAVDHPTPKRDPTQDDGAKLAAALGPDDLTRLSNRDAFEKMTHSERCVFMTHMWTAIANLNDTDADPWLNLIFNRRAI